MKTLNQWIDKYEEKTKDEFSLPNGFNLYWLPERGFAQYRLHEGLLVIYQLCGDIHFWYDLAKLLCVSNGGYAVSAVSILPIKPYLRLLKFKIEKEETVNGKHRYYCTDDSGRPVIATYKGTDKDGTDSYFVTCYVKGETNG